MGFTAQQTSTPAVLSAALHPHRGLASVERSGAGLDAHPLQPPAVQLPGVGPSSPEAQPQEPGSIDLQPVDSWKPRSYSQEKKTLPWEGLFSFSNKWSLKVWGHLAKP